MANAPLSGVVRYLHQIANKVEYKQASDRDLMQRFFADRDEAAFVVLLKRHGPMVLNVCRRQQSSEHDAEDILQATFLLLARNVGSIRKRESVASWLYGVAQRLARELKGRGARRQMRERQAADMRGASRPSEKAWQELQGTLDEALGQVPEKYRTPLLLCYLEGKTQEEAARHLGCPLGTVRSRLARGRDRLKAVLERQGVVLSATSLTAVLVSSSASAALSTTLVRTTAKAALDYAAGNAAAAVVSVQAADLVAKGVKLMAMTKLKIAAVAALFIGTLGVGTGAVTAFLPGGSSAASTVGDSSSGPRPSDRPSAQAKADKQMPAPAVQLPPGKEGQDNITISGNVLGVDGKPAAGAKLWLVGVGDQLVDLGMTGADGGFKVSVPKQMKDKYPSCLVGHVPGAGIDFIRIPEAAPTDPVQLRFVKDNPIKGRVINTEGKAVVGAKVSVSSISIYSDHSVDSFLTEWKKRHFMSGMPSGNTYVGAKHGIFLATMTDDEGRFVINGAGAERVIRLHFSGPGIADGEAWIVNRASFDPKPFNDASRENLPEGFEDFGLQLILNGPDLSVVAQAERLIRGTVKDIDTGKPRAGVKVYLEWYRVSDQRCGPATTDAEGNYELRGARKANSYWVGVDTDRAAGYLACHVLVEDKPGYEPISADIAPKKGVIVTGRMLDAVTKKPLMGEAMIGILSDNPFVKKYPNQGNRVFEDSDATQDGYFRLITIPGPVVLMGGPQLRPNAFTNGEQLAYKPPTADSKYPHYFDNELPYYFSFLSPGGFITPVQGNYCKVLQIDANATEVMQDMMIEPASALPVRIQDEVGQPLKGAWVTGISPHDATRPIQISAESCSAYHLEGKPRLMVFWEPTKKLMGTLALKGDEKEPALAKLGLPGAVKGRLIGEDGKPLVGVIVNVYHSERTASEIHDFVHKAILVQTDSEGRFQLDNVIPGPKFSLWFSQGKKRFEAVVNMGDRSVQTGAVLDVGELKLKLKIDEN